MKLSIIIVLTLLVINAINCSKLPTNCGVSPKQNLWRVIGGRASTPGEWPWQILLVKPVIMPKTGQQGVQMCGGTIINEHWILTAAHCVNDNLNPKVYTVNLGKNDISAHESSGIRSAVSSIHMHPKYNHKANQNDIALLRLNGSIDFNLHRHLHPVCLHSPQQSIDVTKCYATGWGKTEANDIARVLQKVRVSIWKAESCAKRLPHIYSTNICAGGTPEGGTGVCEGDSGGPLQCYMDGKWYQIGITSWGVPCGNRGYPDVYTKVVQYHQWIQQTIAHD